MTGEVLLWVVNEWTANPSTGIRIPPPPPIYSPRNPTFI